VLVSKQQADAAIALLEDALKRTPAYETGYVTLAKIYASVGRIPAAIATLDRLLQRNPSHAGALELRRQWKGL
jgi:predicted Zn-dependent protease